MTRLNILIILFLFFTIELLSQQNHTISDNNSLEIGTIKDFSFSKIGIFAGLSQLNHKATYSVLPGSGDCGVFENGNGNGYFFGALLNYSIFEEILSISGRVYYNYLPFKFEKITNSYQVYNPIKNDYENLVLNNVSEGQFKKIGFSFGIESKPFSFPLIFNLSLNISDAIFGADYKIKQNIESPILYTFNGSNSRDIINSSFTNNTAIDITPEISYEINLLENLYIAPQLSYSYSINSYIKDFDWATTSINFGFSLYSKFLNYPPAIEPLDTIPEPIKDTIPIDTIPIIIVKEEPKVYPKINIEINPIEFTETVVTQTYPVLPYIFFDSLSTNILDKYLHIYSGDFSERNLPKSNLQIYYHLLDIIGSRLKANPDTRIRLVGTTDGLEGVDDENRLELAENRANKIAEYLSQKWQINPGRIKTNSTLIPKLMTNIDYPEAFQENRRVEFYTDDLKILEPIIHNKFFEYKINSKSIDIKLIKDNPELIQPNVRLEIKKFNKSVLIKNFENINDIQSINITDELVSELEKNPKDFEIYLEFKDKADSTYSIKAPISSKINKETFELGRLNLIVFDYNKSFLSKFNQSIISDFINKAIKGNSFVNITGSTDKLGEKEYNLKLSQQRANSVYEFMLDQRNDIEFKEVIGIGDANLLFDNSLPEGRFYCRTVLIESKTPIK